MVKYGAVIKFSHKWLIMNIIPNSLKGMSVETIGRILIEQVRDKLNLPEHVDCDYYREPTRDQICVIMRSRIPHDLLELVPEGAEYPVITPDFVRD